MKVLVVTPWFPAVPGGRDGNYIYDSVQALREAGTEVVVLVVRSRFFPVGGSEKAFRLSYPDGPIVHLVNHFDFPRNFFRGVSNKLMLQAASPVMEQLLNEFRPDAVHIHSEGLAGLVEPARSVGVPVFLTIHGYNEAPGYLDNPVQQQYLRDNFSRANAVICVGPTLIDEFRQQIQCETDNFTVIPNGFTMSEEHLAKPDFREPLKIVSVSNLVMSKGIQLTLEAIANISGEVSCIYTVVGDGPNRSVFERSADKLEVAATFTGSCEPGSVGKYLASSDVFLLPSWREAFGIAYLEAMAAGLLTIGVEGQGAAQFIEDGRTGFLVRPQDSGAIAELLRWIVAHPEECGRIAEQGRLHARQHYGWHRHAELLIALFSGEMK